MSSLDPESSALKELNDLTALSNAKSEAKFFGICSAVLLVILFFTSRSLFQVIVGLILAYTSAAFLFQGLTAISMTLVGVARRRFQIIVSATAPAVLSVYFVKDATSISLQGVFGDILYSFWFLLPLGLIAFFSLLVAGATNPEHPFRGFLIASGILFVICFLNSAGIGTGCDNVEESGCVYTDMEGAENGMKTGLFFGRFLMYIVVSYGAMLTVLVQRTPKKPIRTPGDPPG